MLAMCRLQPNECYCNCECVGLLTIDKCVLSLLGSRTADNGRLASCTFCRSALIGTSVSTQEAAMPVCAYQVVSNRSLSPYSQS